MESRDLGHSDDHRRLEQAIEATGLGKFEWDVIRDVFIVGPRMAEISGLPLGEIAASDGAEMVEHVHPDDRAAMEAFIVELRKGGPYDHEFRLIRPDDGRIVWLRCTGVMNLGPDGQAAALTGLLEDITPRKIEEDQRQILMAELDHRVKNVLAAVQALALQTAKRTTSLESFMQNFGGRLKAMASANELLTAARWRGAAIDHLAAAELSALALGQTHWEGPELFLTPRAANALSLGLHELATNAVKFGALSVDTGRVSVRWARTLDGGFELTWTESGGPTVSQPVRRGFGSTLLEQVTSRELNGLTVIEYRPAGVQARLRAGAAAVAPRPETVPEAPTPRVAETITTGGGSLNLKGARVLIVEDAVLLALELETGLAEAGARIIGPAYELEEALALLDHEIDAAVLDANLNGRSVIPVAEALAARKIPFVFPTGYGEAAGAPGGFDAPVIRKPYDVTQVASAVAELLRATPAT